VKKWTGLFLAACLCISLIPGALADSPGAFTVKVTVPDDVEGELNGRVLFVFDKEMPEDGLVYKNIDVTGCPVFGKTVFGLKAGDSVTLSAEDPEVYGWPMQMGEIPKGEYAAQVFFVKYTQFSLQDGSVIWGMADHGGGGSFKRNPYNLYSKARTLALGEGEVSFVLDQEIPLGYELQEGRLPSRATTRTRRWSSL